MIFILYFFECGVKFIFRRMGFALTRALKSFSFSILIQISVTTNVFNFHVILFDKL